MGGFRTSLELRPPQDATVTAFPRGKPLTVHSIESEEE